MWGPGSFVAVAVAVAVAVVVAVAVGNYLTPSLKCCGVYIYIYDLRLKCCKRHHRKRMFPQNSYGLCVVVFF